jgi:hypothetical protein
MEEARIPKKVPNGKFRNFCFIFINLLVIIQYGMADEFYCKLVIL